MTMPIIKTEQIKAGSCRSDVYGSFKALNVPGEWKLLEIEAAGKHFLKYAQKKLGRQAWDKNENELEEKQKEEKKSEVYDEEEDEEILRYDPKEYKQQDHYAVLGLSKLRYKATIEDIKQGYRQKVLKHHPDKKATQNNTHDDSFFKCIQKAMEILSDPIKRRQYDSIDEKANVFPPSKKETVNFYEQWGKVFESEARFSNQHPVPTLGDEHSSKKDVEEFYNFWYNFDSWRSFEYLDKDTPDDSYNRNNKRYQEHKNRAERAKRKTEDTARLRRLIDDCLSLDPRIKKFRQEEKAAKAAKKHEHKINMQKTPEKTDKEEQEKKGKEEAAKELQKEEKKAKEIQKKTMKKTKKIIKQSLKTANYFYAGENTPPDIIDKVLTDAELIIQKASSDLTTFTKELENVTKIENIETIFKTYIKKLLEEKVIQVSDLKILSI
ncbi:zuotin [Pneumocystis jirovecii RU7]|uniref:J domain-containing protein n=1 Tax=Pneumocystis jirovecii (strain RU7) TaxID=1408657 RepID=A0A0W4ZS46_PNEJ7|nr:zuotin [Pneumocystis jirovecii RU7]KTW31195.1 hypothetical protein T551_01268 [Pneumocystis jirovecii RU7]